MNDQLEQKIETDLSVNDKLSYERTIMAQERTLMATVRTSVSLITFGFTIAKFFHDLGQSKIINTGGSEEATSNIGYILIVIGTVYLLMVSIQHQFVLNSLHVKGIKKRISFTFLLAVIVVIMGILLIISFYSNYLSLGLNQ